MAWRGFSSSSPSALFSLFMGAAILAVGLSCLLKVINIQRLKGEIAQLESRLSQGQEIWKRYPPLNASERSDLQRAQERLFRMLPKDRDIPSLLQDIARLARDHSLSDMSFNTADGFATPGAAPVASQPAGSKPAQSGALAVPEGSKPIESVPVKVAFAGDYREIAFFLEALKRLPRLVTVQFLKVQRGFPWLTAEVSVHAYYQKGELPVAGKK